MVIGFFRRSRASGAGCLGLTETFVGQRPSGAVTGFAAGVPARELDAAEMTGTGDHWSTAADLARLITARHLLVSTPVQRD